MRASKIRNIAIIAHVDHGKTTLVDQLLKQSGVFRENQAVEERIMDSMDLEKEKGITIKSKNTSIYWKDTLINIVDTPGHADFGAEVERVMKMIDGVLLVVDATDGPQAQTRFVLKKAIQNNLQPIVVVNKVDRDTADPQRVHDSVLELLLDLEANDEQFHAPFVYGSARDGWAVKDLNDSRESLEILFDTIIENIPGPEVDEGEFRMLVSNISWDDFVGRVAQGKIQRGSVKQGDKIFRKSATRDTTQFQITKLFEYSGLQTKNSIGGEAGNIVGLAGLEEVEIGDTLVVNPNEEALPFVEIDPPTIEMEFAVNNGAFAGRDGKKVTSRQIRERLHREMRTNVSLKVEDTQDGTRFIVRARGAMQIAILVEEMRREGYELLVSRPTVIFREGENGKEEPFEDLWVDTPEECLGSIMEAIAKRKAKVRDIQHHGSRVNLNAQISTRGMIGLETEIVNLSSGRAVFSHLFDGYHPYAGEIVTRQSGTLVAMEQGKAMAYALDTLQDRGKLFVKPGDEIYVGMIVGENPRRHDLPVNPCKAKKLDNIRSSGDGKGIMLAPPIEFSLEKAIEYIDPDEFVEATPSFIRMRKRILDPHERKRSEKYGDSRG